MLELEAHRKAARDETTTALVVPPSTTSDTSGWSDTTKPSAPSSSSGQPRSGGRNSGQRRNNNRSNHNKSRHDRAPATTTPAATWSPPWPYPWTPPPCPYPTHSGWTQPWMPWSQQPAPATSSRTPSSAPFVSRGGSSSVNRGSGQAYMAEPDVQPTDLGQAFQAMSLQPYTNGQWYMDTGASSHLTSDAGTLTLTSPRSHIRSIFVGNGSSIPVRGTGLAQIPTNSRALHLKNVLHTTYY
ncbi:hypothetical protein RND81_12G235800 [Saponaria officinalis]|uniref:Retrovirus-related Pol polyprotein from transposon TNT 1-94-like beta-barrel domain-containing protein n=1 Tax=Saponaria officinalis TaxID=3572 RepID=A0AAW1HEK6_SAPOF